MSRRRLLDSCLLSIVFRTGPVKGMQGMTPAFWIAPCPRERIEKLLSYVDTKVTTAPVKT